MRNTVKNALLLLEVLLLCVLILLTWGSTLQQAGIVPSFWGRIGMLFGDGGYEQRTGEAPAAYPVRMAMTAENGTLAGISYNESTVNSFYAEVSPLFSDALAQADQFTAADDDELRAALREPSAEMQFATNLPMDLLCGWLEVQQTGTNLPQEAETLVLTRSGRLFVREAGAGLYTARVRIDALRWKKAAGAVAGNPVSYAGLDSACGGLYPESLVTRLPSRYDVLQVAVPKFGDPEDASSVQALLEAFDYSAYAQHGTTDDSSTQVFVENYSTLEVSNEGKVKFRATAIAGGLSAYEEKNGDSINALAAQVDFAQELLTSVLRAVGSTTGTMLQQVYTTAKDDGCVLRFVQTVGGVPVQRAQPLAKFTFQQGVLVSAEFCLRTYTPTGERLYVLPEKQAAAAVHDGKKHLYQIAYTESDSGRALPGALLQ